MKEREQEKVVMPVCKPQNSTKLLKLSCKFGSFLPGSQGKKGNVINFMVCFLLKENVSFSKGRFFSSTGIEIHFLHGPSLRDIEQMY